MKRFLKIISELKEEIIYIFLNYFVCNVPFWPFRKFCYLLFGMKIGKGSRILMKVKVVSPNRISIGKRTYINEMCFLDGRSGIEIGSDVTIAIYSKLISGGHYINDENFAYHGEKIVIQDHVAIFADSILLGGAYIESGCVFSAKSLIRKGRYEKKGLYAGNPAKRIKTRDCGLNYKQDFWHPIFR